MAFLGENALAELWAVIGEKYGTIYLHWWRRRITSSGYYEKFSETKQWRLGDIQDESHEPFWVSNAVKPGSTGGLYMVSPTKISVLPTMSADVVAQMFAGKYFYNSHNTPSGSTLLTSVGYAYPDTGAKQEGLSFGEDGFGERYTLTKTATVTTEFRDVNGEWEYLFADSANAYPNGVVNGAEYEYLGVPFENARNSTTTETGTYTGTGTYNKGNENSLTFSFVPKLLIISGSNSQPQSLGASADSAFINYEQLVHFNGGTYASFMKHFGYNAGRCYYSISNSNKTLTWYNDDSAQYQMNSSGLVYHYIAIG